MWRLEFPTQHHLTTTSSSPPPPPPHHHHLIIIIIIIAIQDELSCLVVTRLSPCLYRLTLIYCAYYTTLHYTTLHYSTLYYTGSNARTTVTYSDHHTQIRACRSTTSKLEALVVGWMHGRIRRGCFQFPTPNSQLPTPTSIPSRPPSGFFFLSFSLSFFLSFNSFNSF